MLLSGGRERIRTAVQGFADLCLATRPLDHIEIGMQMYGYSSLMQKQSINLSLTIYFLLNDF